MKLGSLGTVSSLPIEPNLYENKVYPSLGWVGLCNARIKGYPHPASSVTADSPIVARRVDPLQNAVDAVQTDRQPRPSAEGPCPVSDVELVRAVSEAQQVAVQAVLDTALSSIRSTVQGQMRYYSNQCQAWSA